MPQKGKILIIKIIFPFQPSSSF